MANEETMRVDGEVTVEFAIEGKPRSHRAFVADITSPVIIIMAFMEK